MGAFPRAVRRRTRPLPGITALPGGIPTSSPVSPIGRQRAVIHAMTPGKSAKPAGAAVRAGL